jgi:flagellar hook-basal body complex protein FliE
VSSIGRTSLGDEAIRAALQAQRDVASRVEERARQMFDAQLGGPEGLPELDHRKEAPTETPLLDAVRGLDSEVRRAERLPEDLAAGRITDFHEIATTLKRADLTLKFALEVRNKLVDAYREIMRMQV